VFFLGDRLYGTVTAFVPGAQAVNYHFTSSLAVLLLTALAPELQALIERSTDTSVAPPQLVTVTGGNEALPSRQVAVSGGNADAALAGGVFPGKPGDPSHGPERIRQ
jgi:hypothetical protein